MTDTLLEAGSYRLCHAGADLRAEIDAAYPNRSRKSDGWVGDTAHAARKSDHNPDRRFDPAIVKAIDVTNEGIPYVAIRERVRTLGLDGDERLQGGYIISDGRICGTHTSWVWHTYRGSNAHRIHVHYSFADRREGFDKLGDWLIAPAPPKVVPGVHEHRTATISRLDVGHPAEIRDLQGHLNAWRINRKLSTHAVDGKWDAWLEVALRTFQSTYGLDVDGICAAETWRMIHKVTKGARA